MFVYLDTETTGRGVAWGDKIVEISIVGEDGNVLLDTLVDPERDIPWQVTQIHGITNEMCEGYPTIEELLPEINDIVRGKKVVIYNSNYDIQFFPDRLEQADEVLCAMRTYARLKEKGNRKWVKLSQAAEDVGHEWEGNAHRSLPDTQACRSVWVWLLNNDEILNKTYKSELEINHASHKKLHTKGKKAETPIKNKVTKQKTIEVQTSYSEVESNSKNKRDSVFSVFDKVFGEIGDFIKKDITLPSNQPNQTKKNNTKSVINKVEDDLQNKDYDFFKYMDEKTITWIKNEAQKDNTDIGTIIAAILKDAYFEEGD